MPRVVGYFDDCCAAYIIAEIIPDIFYTGPNIIDWALGEHLDGPVREVSDKTSQPEAFGYPKSGETKADALNAADEYNMSSNHENRLILQSF